ncbi:Tyrosine--tRNA ligase [Candidatus Protochlamydia amoebophila]|uniref:tyrosine--tRNA ligase n=1 Tax=Candidatus Protochlamydia amoebophila TaxID=362787 RepID=UPI001BC9DF66|nr:tyrosine--tRNA ligase [Candidatus Protochlamydia amoebophila]MBS4164523.1 Tyrosine--tRNA ligase [Candidatus Protochlamydia amoebophila]
MTNVIDVLRERGFIDAVTSEEIRQLTNQPIKVYCGFDPTADSLHLGNLVAIMGLAWFQRFGHTPVAIVGGATGMIGDPSGKNAERQLLDEKKIQQNLKGISKNLEAILDFNHPTVPAIILNNLDWFKNFTFISFLRDVGKLFRLSPMLAKDSVKTRLNSEEGMSFTEFCYQILQGYDFLHLFENYGVTVELGGSDQWGNITAGTDLIRKVHAKPAYGITFPLLTKSDGQKFGKSEKGAVWLSPDKLSSYEFYQHLIRVEDADVINLMRMLTFLDMGEIRHYEQMMKEADYVPRIAQKRLAEEITRLVHGEEGLKIAIKVTEGVAPGSQTTLNADILEKLAADMPSCEMKLENVLNKKLIDLLVETKLQTSKSEARRLLRNGGVYINNKKIEDENHIISIECLISSRLILLAAGKKNKMIIRLIEE